MEVEKIKLSRRRRTKLEMLSEPFRNEIEKRLLYESPAQTHQWAKDQGIQISPRTLRNYRNQIIMPKIILKNGLFEKYRPFTEQKIDILSDIYTTIQIQKTRIELGLEKEEKENRLNPTLTKEIDLMQKMLVSTIELERALGIRTPKREEPASMAKDLDQFRILQQIQKDHPNLYKKYQ